MAGPGAGGEVNRSVEVLLRTDERGLFVELRRARQGQVWRVRLLDSSLQPQRRGDQKGEGASQAAGDRLTRQASNERPHPHQTREAPRLSIVDLNLPRRQRPLP